MTTYSISPAHSGTSDTEIAKAKRLYNLKIKSGEFLRSQTGSVLITFTDVNNKIKARYTDNESYTELGEVILN